MAISSAKKNLSYKYQYDASAWRQKAIPLSFNNDLIWRNVCRGFSRCLITSTILTSSNTLFFTLLTRVFGQIYLAKKKLEVSSWLKNVNRNRIGHIRKSRHLNASPRSQIKHITDFHHIFPNQTENLEMEPGNHVPN